MSLQVPFAWSRYRGSSAHSDIIYIHVHAYLFQLKDKLEQATETSENIAEKYFV